MRSPMLDKGGNPLLNVSQISHNQHAPVAGSVSGFGGVHGSVISSGDEYLMQASIYSGGGAMTQAAQSAANQAAQISIQSKRKQ